MDRDSMRFMMLQTPATKVVGPHDAHDDFLKFQTPATKAVGPVCI